MITHTLESLVRYVQSELIKRLEDTEDKTIAISCFGLFPQWKPDKYEVGDIRVDSGVPYECIIDHDSTINPDWTIEVRSIWKPYHSREAKWALPFIHPTGAHDMYKAGEYMVWTDGKTYLCKNDTSYSPEEYSDSWEII